MHAFHRHMKGAAQCVELANQHLTAMLGDAECGDGQTEALVTEAGEKLSECLDLLRTADSVVMQSRKHEAAQGK